MSVNTSTAKVNSSEILAPGGFKTAELFFKAEEISSNIPCLITKKLADIVEQYFHLKPQLIKKEEEMAILHKYNIKLLDTIDSFLAHQKHIVDNYNKISQLFNKSVRAYAQKKNKEVPHDIVKTMRPILDTFSMSEWRFEVEKKDPVQVEKTYGQMLLKVIKKYYVKQHLQQALQRQLQKLKEQNLQQKIEDINHIKQNILMLDTTVTVENMFDFLEKQKQIEFLIRQLTEDYVDQLDYDLNFIDEIAKINSIISDPTKETFLHYIENQNLIRRGMRKKSRKFWNRMQDEYEKIQTENVELKEEIANIQKKNQQIEAERNEFRNKYQYLQLKSGVSKKEKNANNMSVLEDIGKPNDHALKESNKRLEIKVGELEKEIKQLKHLLEDMESEVKRVNVQKQLMNSNTEMGELRLKLCSKLMQLGIEETQALTSGEIFDKILQTISAQITSNPINYPNINIKQQSNDTIFNPSTPKIDMKMPSQPANMYTSIQIKLKGGVQSQKIIKQQTYQQILKLPDSSVEQSSEKQKTSIRVNSNKSNGLILTSGIKTTKEVNSQRKEKIEEVSPPRTQKNLLSPRIASNDLLTIEQIKSAEQYSHPKLKQLSNNQKLSCLKQQDYQILNKELKNQNNQINLQIKSAISQIQQLKAEKQKLNHAFEQFSDIKLIDPQKAILISPLCERIIKQLGKLVGEDLTNKITRITEAFSCNDVKPKNIKQTNLPFNEMPILSKCLTDNDLHDKQSPLKERPKTLTINRLEVSICLQLNQQKINQFANKDTQFPSQIILSQPKIIVEPAKPNLISKFEQSPLIRFNPNQIIDMVNDFGNTSRKKKEQKDSENSLKLSASLNPLKKYNQLSEESDLPSDSKLYYKQDDRYNHKLAQDVQYLRKVQLKLEQINLNSETANDLYWFYKKYKQALEALEKTEQKVKAHEMTKTSCMNKLLEEDATMSKHKLEEKVYFLQQKIKKLEEQLQNHKEEYQHQMIEQLKEMEQLREEATKTLINGIFGPNYNLLV